MQLTPSPLSLSSLLVFQSLFHELHCIKYSLVLAQFLCTLSFCGPADIG